MPLIPVKLQRELVGKIKEWLILSNRSRGLRFVAMRVYDLMQLLIRRRIFSAPGVRAVYLCHSMAAGECYPGLSDFDLVVVFDTADPRDFYEGIRPRWGSLRRYFPINDMSILSVDEFREWHSIGGGWDPLDEVQHWKLVSGEELRPANVDTEGEAGVTDRMAWALGHFQNLLNIAIKEEQRSRFMALNARRQVYKCFWNTVLALHPRYMAAVRQQERIAEWIRDNGTPDPVAQLQAMHKQRFFEGPITELRFRAAALAYRLLDESLQKNPVLSRQLIRPETSRKELPIGNFVEAEERAQAMCTSLREMLEEKLSSIMLGSNGSARGYAIYVILQDGLTEAELADVFRDLRAIHRVYDDLWFNEHVFSGIPTVCSRAMFVARLQTGRSGLHYLEKFRRVLYGPDLYAETLAHLATSDPDEVRPVQSMDWRREKLVYSMHLHQLYLGRSRPVLYEYVTFYLPRLLLCRINGIVPATGEEAVALFSELPDREDGELPRLMFDQYQGKDLDYLIQNMDLDAFNSAWPLLSQELLSETTAQ